MYSHFIKNMTQERVDMTNMCLGSLFIPRRNNFYVYVKLGHFYCYMNRRSLSRIIISRVWKESFHFFYIGSIAFLHFGVVEVEADTAHRWQILEWWQIQTFPFPSVVHSPTYHQDHFHEYGFFKKKKKSVLVLYSLHLKWM